MLSLDTVELGARGNGGGTTFLHACRKGDAECIAVLSRAGCDTGAMNHGNLRAVDFARASSPDGSAKSESQIRELEELFVTLRLEWEASTLKESAGSSMAAGQFDDAPRDLRMALRLTPDDAAFLAQQQAAVEQQRDARQEAERLTRRRRWSC